MRAKDVRETLRFSGIQNVRASLSADNENNVRCSACKRDDSLYGKEQINDRRSCRCRRSQQTTSDGVVVFVGTHGVARTADLPLVLTTGIFDHDLEVRKDFGQLLQFWG